MVCFVEQIYLYCWANYNEQLFHISLQREVGKIDFFQSISFDDVKH